jgi:hypothetical protein
MITLDLARHVAAAFTLAERAERLASVPEEFQALVMKTAALMFAGEIIDLPTVEARREALAQIPAPLQAFVMRRVICAFQARAELRRRTTEPPADRFADAA